MTRLLICGLLLLLAGCGGSTSPQLGLTTEGRLSPCPPSPNCVSSDAGEDDQFIAPLRITGTPEEAWQALLAYLDTQPRWEATVRRSDYARYEASTRLLRFVDDVEFHLRPAQARIAMRSASRVGHSDFGTNRDRLNGVRLALIEAGVVDSGE